MQRFDHLRLGNGYATGAATVITAFEVEENCAPFVFFDRARVVFDYGGVLVSVVVAAQVFEIVRRGRLGAW